MYIGPYLSFTFLDITCQAKSKLDLHAIDPMQIWNQHVQSFYMELVKHR